SKPQTKTRTDSFDSCHPDQGTSDDPYADPFLSELGIFGGARPDYAFVVVQRDGRWYVSPMRTVFDSVLTSLRALTPEQLRSWAQKQAEEQRPYEDKYGTGSSGGSGGRFEPVPGTLVPGTLVPYEPYEDGGSTPTTTRPRPTTTEPRTTTTR